MIENHSHKTMGPNRHIFSRILVTVLFLTFLFPFHYPTQMLRAEATEESATKATSHIQIEGKTIWSGEVPEEGLYPLTPLAWALGYFVQEIPSEPDSLIYITKPGELSDNPADGLIIVNSNPADHGFHFAHIYQLTSRMDGTKEIPPNLTAPYLVELAAQGVPMNIIAPTLMEGTKAFERNPVLKDGELYLAAEDLAPIVHDGAYEEEGTTINFTSVSFGNYVHEVWQPGHYTNDDYERALQASDDEAPYPPLYAPVEDPELLADRLTVFANLSRAEGLTKPTTTEEYLAAAAQLIANDYATQELEAPKDVAIEDVLQSIEDVFGFYVLPDDLSSLPAMIELPEGFAAERVYADRVENSGTGNYERTVIYTNPVKGQQEEAIVEVEVAFDFETFERSNRLILKEIKVITE